MPTVVGVKLRYAGKMLHFDPAGFAPEEGDNVIVSTERGQEFGEIVMAPKEVPAGEVPAELKPVLRIADDEDRAKVDGFLAREREELEAFRRLVDKHKLDMKPVGVEHLFDDSKMVFYFSAEERVDFRELVRELASEFHSRIDMRQVGVRDEARMVGGLGHCGQPLCCVRFPGDFQPVSIRMAKEQDLPLNPLKISGLCGRLMCCLRYEYEAYKDFKQRAPKCGTPVEMPGGDAKIVALNVPRETVTIRPAGGGNEVTVPLEALDCSAGRGCPCKLSAEALEQVAPPAAVVAGRAPQLREAEKSEEPEGDTRARRPRRKRTPAKDQGQPKQGQPKQGQPKQGQPKQGQPKQGQAKQQAPRQAPQGESTQAPTGARRRRRRRPRPEGPAAPPA